MIIKNCTIITWGTPNQIIENQALLIKEGAISEFGPVGQITSKYPFDTTIDAKGQLLMPGLICAHTHFYGAFSRGMAIKGEAPADFPLILDQLWWPLDQSLHTEDVYYSALCCMIDAIKHGTTTLFDHHASPSCIEGSLDTIEAAFNLAGLRGSVCYEVTDRGGVAKAEEGIAENVRMINKTRSQFSEQSLVTAMFGLHASLTLSDETLFKCQNNLPAGSGFHIHTAEHQSDEFDSQKKSGSRVIDRLEHYDITGHNSIFVHGVHLDFKEAAILSETRTWLTHQPRSNMNNAVGMAAVESYLRMGIPVCLGNDGFSNAMWEEWRACYLSHKLWTRDPRSMPGNLVVEMGAYNNRLLASHFFNSSIGVIEKGARADIILVDYQPITPLTIENLPWHLLFGFRDSMVTTTIVNGKLIMEDRKILSLSECNISEESRRLASGVWDRYNRL